MQTLIEKVCRINPPGGIFGDPAVRNLFPETSAEARKLLVHRTASKGEVLRLKPGLHCLAAPYQKI